MDKLVSQLKDMDQELALLHKTYIRGLGEMKLPVPLTRTQTLPFV